MSARDLATRVVARGLGAGAAERFSSALSVVDRTTEQGRRLLTLPSPFWRPSRPWKRYTPEQGAALIGKLREEGLIAIPDFLSAEQLASVQRDLDAQFLPEPKPGMDFRPKQAYFAHLQPLSFSRTFAEAAIDADLVNLAGGYFRREPFLSESDFRRVMPIDLAAHEKREASFAKGHSSSHWHFDLHGREIKVMIYLTDVGPDDQNFAYCMGSHAWFRSANYDKSRFNDRQLEQMGVKPTEILATAGTAVVFESNGIHRLRRKPTRLRDSVTFNYCPGRRRNFAPQRVERTVLDAHRAEFERLTVIAS